MEFMTRGEVFIPGDVTRLSLYMTSRRVIRTSV